MPQTCSDRCFVSSEDQATLAADPVAAPDARQQPKFRPHKN